MDRGLLAIASLAGLFVYFIAGLFAALVVAIFILALGYVLDR